MLYEKRLVIDRARLWKKANRIRIPDENNIRVNADKKYESVMYQKPPYAARNIAMNSANDKISSTAGTSIFLRHACLINELF